MRGGLICLMAAGLAWGSQPYRARHAMVVSGETHASEIGVRVLRAGGNAMIGADIVAKAPSAKLPKGNAIEVPVCYDAEFASDMCPSSRWMNTGVLGVTESIQSLRGSSPPQF